MGTAIKCKSRHTVWPCCLPDIPFAEQGFDLMLLNPKWWGYRVCSKCRGWVRSGAIISEVKFAKPIWEQGVYILNCLFILVSSGRL